MTLQSIVGKARDWCESGLRYVAFALAFTAVPLAASAQVAGRAEGLDVRINLVAILGGGGLTVPVGPIPVAQLPSGGGTDSASILNTGSLGLGTLLSTGLLTVETSSAPGNTTINSVARVNGLNIAAGLIEADTMTATCSQTPTGLVGQLEVENLNLLGAGVQLVAPNTQLNVLGLAGLTLNKQELSTSGGVNTLKVTGLEVRVLSSAPGFGGIVGSLLNIVSLLLYNVANADISLLEVTCSMPAMPTITGVTAAGVTPAIGPDTGGTVVTITGTNFVQGTTVTFGSATPVTATVTSPTQLTATTPAHPAGVVNVGITTPVGATVGATTLPNGTATAANAFTYLLSTSLTSVLPTSGPTTGGYNITLSGSFPSVDSVTIGGVPASVVSSTTSDVVVTAPANVAGPAQIVVVTGTGSATGSFTYVSAPTITSVGPSQVGPGQTLTIAGTDFYPGLTVTVCGQPAVATTPAVGPFTAFTVVAPTCPDGPANIVVTNPDGGVASAVGAVTFATAPSISSVTPATGPLAGGTAIVISGANFDADATVTFDGTPATGVTFVNATTLNAVTPAHAAGAVPVAVTTSAGTGTLPSGFTYVVTLPPDCAAQFGLDPSDTAGDPDGDGRTNLEECTSSPITHPRGFFTAYFGEGAQSPTFFNTQFALLNPDSSKPARVLATFQLGAAGTPNIATFIEVPSTSSRTIEVGNVPGMESAEFATLVESDLPIATTRLQEWDRTEVYGSHSESQISHPGLTWYLAEGATIGNFQLFYLVQNPNDTDATIEVDYLLANGSPITRAYSVPAKSRFNIWVNLEPGLEQAELSAVVRVTNNQPVIVERAMYIDSATTAFVSGHNVAAITAPQTTWYFTEGSTGEFFDTFLLVANPNDGDVNLEVTYYLEDGTTQVRNHTVRGKSRYNIWVDVQEGQELAAAPFSARLVASAPVVAERAMWWPGDPAAWYEAHASAGLTTPYLKWAVPEGQAGGPRHYVPWLLVNNPNGTQSEVSVTLHFEDGTRTSFPVSVRAMSRASVNLADIPGTEGKRFGVIVESTNGVPVLVESALYSDTTSGQFWGAGSNAPGTPVP